MDPFDRGGTARIGMPSQGRNGDGCPSTPRPGQLARCDVPRACEIGWIRRCLSLKFHFFYLLTQLHIFLFLQISHEHRICIIYSFIFFVENFRAYLDDCSFEKKTRGRGKAGAGGSIPSHGIASVAMVGCLKKKR